MEKKEKVLYTNAQLGFLVLSTVVGIGAVVLGLCLMVLSETEVGAFQQVLNIVEVILGFTVAIVSMHDLHYDLRKRWVK